MVGQTLHEQSADQANYTKSIFPLQCLEIGTQPMMDLMAGDNPLCDIAVASITITSERQASGVQFAYPYEKGALGILTKTQMGGSEGWAWVRPFSVDLWVAIAVTMAIWPVAIFLIEIYSMRRRLARRHVIPGFLEAWVRHHQRKKNHTCQVSAWIDQSN